MPALEKQGLRQSFRKAAPEKPMEVGSPGSSSQGTFNVAEKVNTRTLPERKHDLALASSEGIHFNSGAWHKNFLDLGKEARDSNAPLLVSDYQG